MRHPRHYFRLFDFSEGEDDFDDELSDLLLLVVVLSLETGVPDLRDDELTEELPGFPYDLECEPDEKDSFPELRLVLAFLLPD